jgi:hypothetical protein
MRNARAVKQRFQLALFALGHLFLCNTGECHGGALSQTRAPSVRQSAQNRTHPESASQNISLVRDQ